MVLLAPLLGALLRGLTAARGAAAAEGGAAAARGATARAAAGSGAAAGAAKPPGIDYGKLIASMGNPNARRDAENEAQAKDADEREQAARQKLVDSWKAVMTAGTGAAAALLGLPKATKIWTDSLVESRRELARFNPRIAAAMGALDVQRIRNQFRLGGATAGTTVQLSKAIGEFREAMLPLETIARNGINVLATGITKVATGVANLINGVLSIAKHVPGLGKAVEEIEKALKKGDGALPAQQLMDAFKKADVRPGARDPLPPIL